MSPMDVKCRWMFAVQTVILFYGMFLKDNVCESSDTEKPHRLKKILFVIANKAAGTNISFPSDAIYDRFNRTTLCFAVQEREPTAACCNTENFSCRFKINHEALTFTIQDKNVLSEQDVVWMTGLDRNFSCMPSKFYSNTGFLLNIHKCLEMGKKNIRFSPSLCGKDSPYDEEACKDFPNTTYIITVDRNKTKNRCVSCKPPDVKGKPETSSPLSFPSMKRDNKGRILPESAANAMKNLAALVEQMGNASTAAIATDDIKGILIKLPSRNHKTIQYAITGSGDINIVENNTESKITQTVNIPKEAFSMATERNATFAGVVIFPRMYQDDPNSFFLCNKVVGIEMGREISNLSQTIDILYSDVNKSGMIASCRSWNGEASQTWITDGCRTQETNGTITCQCSHLTFFAILMSPAPSGNISASDFKSLSKITSAGCGLSMFFLVVALFMHCLIRKGKATPATKILMNLFVAMLVLNLSFLINASIANLGNYNACVVMAAVMHYAMLATFSWFFVEALHLYFNMWKIPNEIKHYMIKICITGWVTPAVVVIALLALRKYDYMVIYTDDGNSEKMCWISDALVHQVVNIGYYAVVFVFTVVIFIITVRQIVLFQPPAEKGQSHNSIRKQSFSILGLFLLLGISWAFAFFSYGPLLLASYYIFTILNSFQGFFLFIYYYFSSRIVAGDKTLTVGSGSTATSNTVAPVIQSPYQ